MENKRDQGAARLHEQYLAELAGEDPGEKTVAAWGAEKKSVSGGQQEAGEKARRLREQYLAELAGEDPGEKTVAAWGRKESANERGEREAREKAEREAREKAEREAKEKAEREAKKPVPRPAPRSKKPLILGLCAVALLVFGLYMIFLRPKGEGPQPVDNDGVTKTVNIGEARLSLRADDPERYLTIEFFQEYNYPEEEIERGKYVFAVDDEGKLTSVEHYSNGAWVCRRTLLTDASRNVIMIATDYGERTVADPDLVLLENSSTGEHYPQAEATQRGGNAFVIDRMLLVGEDPISYGMLRLFSWDGSYPCDMGEVVFDASGAIRYIKVEGKYLDLGLHYIGPVDLNSLSTDQPAKQVTEPMILESEWDNADRYITAGSTELAVTIGENGLTEKLLVRADGEIDAKYVFSWENNRINCIICYDIESNTEAIRHEFLYDNADMLDCVGVCPSLSATEMNVTCSMCIDGSWTENYAVEMESLPNAVSGYPLRIAEDAYMMTADVYYNDTVDYYTLSSDSDYFEWYTPHGNCLIGFCFYMGINSDTLGGQLRDDAISIVWFPEDSEESQREYYDASWNAVDPW